MGTPRRIQEKSIAFRLVIGWFCVSSAVVAMGCSAPIDQGAERETLLETDKAFSDASVQRGAAKSFHMYLTEDALQLPDGALPVLGRESIRAAMSAFDNYELSWQPQDAVVSKSGDLGYTWGYYKLTSKGDQETTPPPSSGKYLTVWKKQENNSWKVVVDIGNSDVEL